MIAFIAGKKISSNNIHESASDIRTRFRDHQQRNGKICEY